MDLPATGPTGRTIWRDIESWTAVTSHTLCRMKDFTTEQKFYGELDIRHSGPIRMVKIRSTTHEVNRTAKFARSDAVESVLVALQRTGDGIVEQDGRQAHLTTMSLSLFDTSRPYRLCFGGPFEHLVMQVPKHALGRRLNAVSRFTAMPICGRQGEGAVFASFLMQLAQATEEIDPVNADRLSEISIDLLATVLSGQSGCGPASRLFRLKNRLLNNIRDGSLDLAVLAAAEGLSLRSAQRLFQAEGTTAMAWLMEERLRRAASELASDRYGKTQVTQIAFSWGFNDVTHFDRAFRKRFGESPREYRANHRSCNGTIHHHSP